MAFEDKTLQCVDCNEQFIFSANEQEFFQQKQLTSEPKRCKPCRQKAKKRKRSQQNPYKGEYRSPAFNDSQLRNPRNHRRGGGNQQQGQRQRRPEYRSPSFKNEQSNFSGEYRSPAFREYEAMDNAEDYRSPAFKEYEKINPQEEYRSPAFREYDGINPAEEYRSPAFANAAKSQQRTTERPMFSIICVACGEHAMVPFIPEEKDDPMCKNCYREHRELLKKEQEEEDRLEKERLATEQANEVAPASPAELAPSTEQHIENSDDSENPTEYTPPTEN